MSSAATVTLSGFLSSSERIFRSIVIFKLADRLAVQSCFNNSVCRISLEGFSSELTGTSRHLAITTGTMPVLVLAVVWAASCPCGASEPSDCCLLALLKAAKTCPMSCHKRFVGRRPAWATFSTEAPFGIRCLAFCSANYYA